MSIAELVTDEANFRNTFREKFEAEKADTVSPLAVLADMLIQEGNNRLRTLYAKHINSSPESLFFDIQQSKDPQSIDDLNQDLGAIVIGATVKTMLRAHEEKKLDVKPWAAAINNAAFNIIEAVDVSRMTERELTEAELEKLQKCIEADETLAGFFGAYGTSLPEDFRKFYRRYARFAVLFANDYRKIAQAVLAESREIEFRRMANDNTKPKDAVEEAVRIAVGHWCQRNKEDEKAARGCGCPQCERHWQAIIELNNRPPVK